MSSRKHKKGFTVLEVLIVIAIVGILTVIVVTGFQKFNRVESVNRDTETVLETLRSARDQTVASKNELQYGVHFGTQSITLFSGTSYSSGAAGNQVYPLHSGDTILSTVITGGGSNVIFQRLTGQTADYGTVTISSMAASSSNNVIIYDTGLVQGPASI